MGLDDGIALDRTLQAALVESRQRFKDLVEISSDFAWETDATGRFVFVSSAGALGWSAADLVGASAASFVLDEGGWMFSASAPLLQRYLQFRRADGTAAALAVSAVPVGNGTVPSGARGVCRDVTLELERERALATAQLRLGLFARILRVVRDEPDPAAAIRAAIAELAHATGAAGGTVLRGADPLRMLPLAHWGEAIDAESLRVAVAALSFATKHAAPPARLGEGGEQGRFAGALASCRQVIEGAVLLWHREDTGAFAETDRALVADVADYVGLLIAQHGALESVVMASRTDPLTGLMNRRAFFEQVDRALVRLAHRGRTAPGGALLYIDLDHFKLVNDRKGHAAGDQALKDFAAMLASVIRGGDLAARLGGDEFVLWIDGIGRQAANHRAERLREACRPLAGLTGDPRRPLSPAIGIALARPSESIDAAGLVACADRAMYAAKQARRRLAATEPA